MKPDRLWYRTFNGKKWHLMAAQNPTRHEWTLCGATLEQRSWRESSVLPKRDLCKTCVELSAERPR